MHLCIQSADPAAAPCSAILLILLQLLLLAVSVRHRVPHSKDCCWLMESDFSLLSFFSQTRFHFNAPLCSTVAITAFLFLYYILGSWKLWACPEPRLESVDRGEGPLELQIYYALPLLV